MWNHGESFEGGRVEGQRLSRTHHCEWCIVAWCVVAWCGMVWHGVAWCGMMWCGVVWWGVAWCGVVERGVVWCNVVWFIFSLQPPQFVTRAVRVIDLITNLDAQSFQAYGAMHIFINRLQVPWCGVCCGGE